MAVLPRSVAMTDTNLFDFSRLGWWGRRSPVQKKGLCEVDKYQIVATILEKLFYAHLFCVIALAVIVALAAEYYGVPAPAWLVGIK